MKNICLILVNKWLACVSPVLYSDKHPLPQSYCIIMMTQHAKHIVMI